MFLEVDLDSGAFKSYDRGHVRPPGPAGGGRDGLILLTLGFRLFNDRWSGDIGLAISICPSSEWGPEGCGDIANTYFGGLGIPLLAVTRRWR